MISALVLLLTAVAARGELRGETLQCCAVVAAPYVYESDVYEDGGLEGLSITYLEGLEKNLGFKCNVTRFVPKDGTGWNELVENIGNCSKDGRIDTDKEGCYCELGVGAWFENEDRMAVDFLPAFIHDSLNVLINVKDTSTSTSGAFFLTAFSPTVWVCISVLIAVFTFLKLLDRRFAPPDASFVPLPEREPKFRRVKYYLLKSKIPYRLRRAVQSTFSRMIGQATMEIDGDDGSTRQWVLNFAIALCGIFLILAYEATMTASLVQETVQSDFRRVSDLKSCRIPSDDICFVRGDITQSFWNNSIATKECREDEAYPRTYDNYDKVLKALADGDCKFVISGGGVGGDAVNNRYCGKMIMTGDSFFRSGLSFILPHDSPFKDELRKATLKLKGEDAIETLEQYFGRNECAYRSSPTLTFKKLAVFFILAFSSCVLIFCEMVVDPQAALRGEGGKGGDGERSIVAKLGGSLGKLTTGESLGVDESVDGSSRVGGSLGGSSKRLTEVDLGV